jgi:RimJ/RimL family protein N-acetyltransferase
MVDAAHYSARELMRDGSPIEIRSLRQADQGQLLAAVERTSKESLYRRFFGPKREFTDKEIEFFTNIDFVNHVALVAVVDQPGGGSIVGGGRYIVVQPGTAELAFAVVDQYQGQAIGAALLHHLIAIARAAGLKEFVADVLPSNTPMLKLFAKCGLPVSTKREGGAVRVTLRL